jgi:hypothetical protein
MKKKITIIALFSILLLLSPKARAVNFEYDSHGKRDPFVSSGDLGWGLSQLGLGDLQLEGVILDDRGSYAIINGQIVQAGDPYGGFEIVEIKSNRVVLEKDGDKFELILRRDQEILEKLFGGDETRLANDAVAETEEDDETLEELPQAAAESSEAEKIIVDEELKKLAEVTKKKIEEKQSAIPVQKELAGTESPEKVEA